MSRAPRRQDRTDCPARRLHLEVRPPSGLAPVGTPVYSGSSLSSASRPDVSRTSVTRIFDTRMCTICRISRSVVEQLVVAIGISLLLSFGVGGVYSNSSTAHHLLP